MDLRRYHFKVVRCLAAWFLAFAFHPVSQSFAQSSEPADEVSRSVVPREERSLEVKTDKAIYRHDDQMTVTVRATKDGFLRVYAVDSKNQTVQIFPNRWEQNNKVRAGDVVVIPNPEVNKALVAKGEPRYELGVTLSDNENASKEMIHAILSKDQFQDQTLTSYSISNPYPDQGQTTMEVRRTRGMLPKATNQQAQSGGGAASAMGPNASESMVEFELLRDGR